jgi:hypothetical protein
MATQWDEGTRAKATQIGLAKGAREASRQCGVPYETIRGWVRKAQAAAGVTHPPGTKEQRVSEGTRISWQARRADAAAAMGEAVMEAIDRLRRELTDGRASAARDAAVAMAVVVDKAQLITTHQESAEDLSTATPETRMDRLTYLFNDLKDRASNG